MDRLGSQLLLELRYAAKVIRRASMIARPAHGAEVQKIVRHQLSLVITSVHATPPIDHVIAHDRVEDCGDGLFLVIRDEVLHPPVHSERSPEIVVIQARKHGEVVRVGGSRMQIKEVVNRLGIADVDCDAMALRNPNVVSPFLFHRRKQLLITLRQGHNEGLCRRAPFARGEESMPRKRFSHSTLRQQRVNAQ
jgi:hypothetical protein